MTQQAAAAARRPARPGRHDVTASGLAPGRPTRLTGAPERSAYRPHRIQILPGRGSPRILLVGRRVIRLAGASDASHYYHAASGGGLAHAGAILVLTLLTISTASAAIAAVRPGRRRRLPRCTHLAASGLLGIYLAARGIAAFLLAGYARAGRYRSCLSACYARDPVTTVLRPTQH
jgi:hypothetical protein